MFDSSATPSRSPVVERAWIGPGTHINALGADGPGKQELDSAILREGRIVIDDPHQAEGGGEINVPLARGELAMADVHATLGEVVNGTRPGREGDEITVFDSTGLAIQDVAVARIVYDEAVRRGAADSRRKGASGQATGSARTADRPEATIASRSRSGATSRASCSAARARAASVCPCRGSAARARPGLASPDLPGEAPHPDRRLARRRFVLK